MKTVTTQQKADELQAKGYELEEDRAGWTLFTPRGGEHPLSSRAYDEAVDEAYQYIIEQTK